MTDSHDICPDEHQLVALALGELSGRARADVLTHLMACRSCREQVDQLIEVAEHLLLVAPEAEPPVGFESGVVDQFVPASKVRTRRLRVTTAVAGIAAAVALVAAGGVGARLAERGHSDIAEAQMITPTGRDVGNVWQYQGDPSWIFVAVPGWRNWDVVANAELDYRLEAQLHNGSTVDLGPIAFSADDGSWATTTTLDTTTIATVSIVDDTGHVWCSGTF